MRNQGFGPLKYFLVPFLPLVWWMDRQSDFEVMDEISHFQEVERGRLHPYHEFIELSPEEILYGESEYYPAFQQAGPLGREYLRAAMDHDLPVIEGMLRTPLLRERDRSEEVFSEAPQVAFY